MKDVISFESSVADSTSNDPQPRLSMATGTLAGFSGAGVPLLNLSSDPIHVHVAARSCVSLDNGDVGKQVVIIHDSEQPHSPIVIGIIQPPATMTSVKVTADGRTVTVNAEESIILKCGDSSITLNRDGKVMIRGRHVVTHASGVNRIRGGSVQLN